MKGFWNDGTSAVNYYPTLADRKREKSISIEYVHLPAYAEPSTIAQTRNKYKIKTKTIHIITLSLLLSLQWLHYAVICVMALLLCSQWIAAFCSHDANVLAQSIFITGITSSINTTIILLLYRYNLLLCNQLDKIETLRKRKNIIHAAKTTSLMFVISCIAIYGIVVPGLAKILQQII